MPASTYSNLALAEKLVAALDALSGLHPGNRPAHAKGLMCSGSFTPAPDARKLTSAPHANRPSTPITVRFSISTGVPTIPDNPKLSFRRVRFQTWPSADSDGNIRPVVSRR